MKAIVIHSGGLDSSLCLALAIREFGNQNVLSLSFDYHQRHSAELMQAEKICQDWDVLHTVIRVDCLREITENALVNSAIPIEKYANNTLVVGRNGLMARLGAIYAHSLGVRILYMGVIQSDGQILGYRDCSRDYMDLLQQILRLDLNDPTFEIRTPLVHKTKKESLDLAHQLGIFDYLVKETISCYNGIRGRGCQNCPSCRLRNEALSQFTTQVPFFARMISSSF